jgi:hypothetical protein
MKRRRSDAVVGLLVLLACTGAVWLMSGRRGVFYVVLCFFVGGIVISLFGKQSKWARGIAVAMVPALLLTYFKPDVKKQFSKIKPPEAPSPPEQ